MKGGAGQGVGAAGAPAVGEGSLRKRESEHEEGTRPCAGPGGTAPAEGTVTARAWDRGVLAAEVE